MKISRYLILLILLCSCTAYKNIEPVGKDKVRANIDFGGPIVSAFNTKISIPYLAAGIDYGLTDNLDINANLHILPIFYKISGIEVGSTYFITKNSGLTPTIGINGSFMLFSSLKSGIEDRFRLVPLFTPSFAWQLSSGIIYTGSHFTLPLNKLDYADNNSLIISPFVGYRWDLGSTYRLFSEIKWQAVNVQSDKLVVEYLHPSGHGGLGIYLSLERSF